MIKISEDIVTADFSSRPGVHTSPSIRMTDNKIIDRLRRLSESRIKNAPVKFHRFLLDEIDWDQRLIGISGARGTGKTTLILQYLKIYRYDPETVIFVSMDDIYFVSMGLFDFAEQFFLEGGKYLFLDEVHKYPQWSHDLKQIYDNFPQLKIVLQIHRLLRYTRAYMI